MAYFSTDRDKIGTIWTFVKILNRKLNLPVLGLNASAVYLDNEDWRPILTLELKKMYLPDKTETPFAGLTVDWYLGSELVCYKLTAVSEDIVSKWAELVQSTLKDWPKDKPYLAIHDLSQAGVSLQYAALVNFDMLNLGITMGGRILAEERFNENPEWTGRLAVNFNLTLSGQTNRTLLSYLNQEHPRIKYKSFYNRTKCILWLNSKTGDTAEVKTVDA
jgi:hypothetical protein